MRAVATQLLNTITVVFEVGINNKSGKDTSRALKKNLHCPRNFCMIPLTIFKRLNLENCQAAGAKTYKGKWESGKLQDKLK